jgi:hypothetical protein
LLKLKDEWCQYDAVLLLGICFWLAIETAFGPDWPACRSLLDRRSFSEGGGEVCRSGERGVSVPYLKFLNGDGPPPHLLRFLAAFFFAAFFLTTLPFR